MRNLVKKAALLIPAINCIKFDGSKSLASIYELTNSPQSFRDIDESPLVRLAVLRLLLAVMSESNGDANNLGVGWAELFGSSSCDLYGQNIDIDSDGDGFLQTSGLPESSARTSHNIINMIDGGNMALSVDSPKQSESTDLLALLVSYFCDRPGLKARVSGLSISGQCPLHMGRTTTFKSWGNIAEFLELNWIPDTHQYLMHRWRRLQIVEPGKIVIAPGDKFTHSGNPDPWTMRKTRPAHKMQPITVTHTSDIKKSSDFVQRFKAGQSIDLTALVLDQASPVAMWACRSTVVKADT